MGTAAKENLERARQAIERSASECNRCSELIRSVVRTSPRVSRSAAAEFELIARRLDLVCEGLGLEYRQLEVGSAKGWLAVGRTAGFSLVAVASAVGGGVAEAAGQDVWTQLRNGAHSLVAIVDVADGAVDDAEQPIELADGRVEYFSRAESLIIDGVSIDLTAIGDPERAGDPVAGRTQFVRLVQSGVAGIPMRGVEVSQLRAFLTSHRISHRHISVVNGQVSWVETSPD